MRVLVLHQHYWPEIAATAQILSDLCEDLADAGHEVHVLCGQPSYRTSEGAFARRPARERWRGVQIERVWSYTPEERGTGRRIVHYASFFGSSLAAALVHDRPDVCLVMSTPPLLLGISGSLLRLLRGVPFVYSVQDLYPDVAIHLGLIKERGVVAGTVHRLANYSYAQATALVTLSTGMRKCLVEKGVPPERVHVVPNWADTSHVEPSARDNPLAREYDLCSKFVIQYSGNVGQSQGLEHVILAADMLRDLPITFLFAGDGNARPRLEKMVQQRALENVRFIPPQPRERLPLLLGACDVGLVPMKRGVANDLVPSKLYGIMAAARPILASVESRTEVARVVKTHECGLVVAPESADALAEGIQTALAAGELERRRLGENGRAACMALFSREVLTQRYEQILREAAREVSSHLPRMEDGVRTVWNEVTPQEEVAWPTLR